MVYSPHPPDCTEIIEKDVIPEFLRKMKYFCLSFAAFIILPGIYAYFGMPKYIFWPLFIIEVVNMGYWSLIFQKIKCPNCETSIFISARVYQKNALFALPNLDLKNITSGCIGFGPLRGPHQ